MGSFFSKSLKRKRSEDNLLPKSKKIRLKSTSEYICERLFRNGDGHDVIIEAFGKEWKLHKVYLSQSSYFQCMFSQDWVESQAHIIKLNISDDNINEHAFSTAIESLYNDSLQIQIDQAPSILAATRWFGMDDLFSQCAMIMIENIKLDNVVNLYKYAIQYGANDLSETCLQYLGERIMLIKNDVTLLKQISPIIMELLISSTNLCVHLAEVNLYFMLRRWLCLNVQSESNVNEAEHFKNIFKETNIAFLELPESKQYIQAFALLRYQWIICDIAFYNILITDKIIPNSWIQKSVELNYQKILEINSLLDTGPLKVDVNFLKICWRGGRTLLALRNQSWRFVGFNFGWDFYLKFNQRSIKIRRNVRESFHSIDQSEFRYICYRVRVKSYNAEWNLTGSISSGPSTLLMHPNIDYDLITLPMHGLDYPLRFSLDFLPYTPSPELSTLAKWRMQNIHTHTENSCNILSDMQHQWKEISIIDNN